jgi:hypothetical protein
MPHGRPDGGHAPVLNPYHLPNHANLLGAGYVSSIRRVSRRFAD